MSELEQYIKSYFAILDEDSLRIAQLFHSQEIKKGDFFLKSGRNCEKLSFIQSGLLRVFVITADKEVTPMDFN
jgi:CRP/FNR family transcriptional regulator, anaerobic regulatory protein